MDRDAHLYTPKQISIHSLRMEGDSLNGMTSGAAYHFNPLPPYGGRLVGSKLRVRVLQFQSTPSVWRETCRGRRCAETVEFQSTPSVWRETPHFHSFLNDSTFQSTPSVWRETQPEVSDRTPAGISIHSLRMEGDLILLQLILFYSISIHSLRMEGDLSLQCLCSGVIDISIHSLRMEGDGKRGIGCGLEAVHFNPLPPYGGRPGKVAAVSGVLHFNPLPPYGGRLQGSAPKHRIRLISIHSLRMEGDIPVWFRMRPFRHFNPLPPYGGRPLSPNRCSRIRSFQSTPSVWRETPADRKAVGSQPFQSTPSVWRETQHLQSSIAIVAFQSTPSVWRETYDQAFLTSTVAISIHSLRMEGDSKTAQESVFHFAYPCTILQKRMQKTTFCTRKNDFFRKKGEKFGAKPPASFCAPMIRTDIFPQTSLTESAALPCLWFPLHRYVPPSTDNDFPGNKTAGCPFLYQSPVPADA